MSEPRTTTAGVDLLLGDHRRAIWRLSMPLIVAMSAHTLYNLIDAIWVSGVGPEALSAVGFFFPYFFLMLALANGLGIGGGAAISRRIGSQDREGADAVATTTIVLMLILSAGLTALSLLLARPVFRLMGAGEVLDLTLDYSNILFAGMGILFFSSVSQAILRSEGDTRRAMVAMVLGAGLNILLDPIFIYALDMGVVGAAWATLLSIALTGLLLFRWLFLDRSTYVKFRLRGFRFRRDVVMDIVRVGGPATVSMASMSIMAFALTAILSRVGGPDGVAVYAAGWRVVSLAILPMLGIATAYTSIAGASFGARDFEKLRASYRYTLRMGILLEAGIALFTLVAAPWITKIFTWSEDTARLADELTRFLRVMWVFYPAVCVGMVSSSLFQGAGRGLDALGMTFLRTLVFTVPYAFVAGIVLDKGLLGVWIAIALANLSYMPFAFGWAWRFLGKLSRQASAAGPEVAGTGSAGPEAAGPEAAGPPAKAPIEPTG